MTDITSTERKIFESVKTIGFVGLSPKKEKTSNSIGRYLIKKGFTVYPVYPGDQENILGLRVYRSLRDIQPVPDMILLFVNKARADSFADDILLVKPKALWLPEGVESKSLQKLAYENDMLFIMDRCIYKEHVKYLKSLE